MTHAFQFFVPSEFVVLISLIRLASPIFRRYPIFDLLLLLLHRLLLDIRSHKESCSMTWLQWTMINMLLHYWVVIDSVDLLAYFEVVQLFSCSVVRPMLLGFHIVSHLSIELFIFVLNALQFLDLPSGQDVLFF